MKHALRWTTFGVVLALMTIAAVGTSSANPAHQATLQWPVNNGVVYLTSTPVANGGSAIIERNIYLAADTYVWRELVGLPNSDVFAVFSERTITLAAGNYYWRCAIDQHAGRYGSTCYLRLGSNQPAYLSTTFFNPKAYYPGAGGNYYYGSTLQGI